MNQVFRKKRYTVNNYADGILSGNRIMLSKSITLVESKLASDNELAEKIIKTILPLTGSSVRIAISGIPGAGKSTFIECFGNYLTAAGKKVAVLTIDPSSKQTRGSILGDKTRMEQLSNNINAFVRPSSSGTTPGGVHSKTRESILLCEAAGFDVIIVETIGVGQNEITVRSMVDFFILLLIAGAGDELQGIKRGIVEVADAIVVNKADGDNLVNAALAKMEYQNALHLLATNTNGWQPVVTTCSSLNGDGIYEVWELVCKFEDQMKSNGFFEKQRGEQNVSWLHDIITSRVQNLFYQNTSIKKQRRILEHAVAIKKITAAEAADMLMKLFANRAER
jgi:LAO/AO transport system kinase